MSKVAGFPRRARLVSSRTRFAVSIFSRQSGSMPGGGGSAGRGTPYMLGGGVVGPRVRNLGRAHPPLPYTDPRATTHSIGWPVTEAIRSKSAS